MLTAYKDLTHGQRKQAGYRGPNLSGYPQCCGSGSVFRSILHPDPYSENGSTHVNIG